MLCPKCYSKMVGVMSFSKDRREKFQQCKRCYEETKHNTMNESDLDFGEYLNREMKR